MLYSNFHSFASLHAVPVSRIRAMESCQLPTEPIRCVIRELDVSNLKKEELTQLNDLIDGYNKDLAFIAKSRVGWLYNQPVRHFLSVSTR